MFENQCKIIEQEILYEIFFLGEKSPEQILWNVLL